jgi:hypothetical protein
MTGIVPEYDQNDKQTYTRESKDAGDVAAAETTDKLTAPGIASQAAANKAAKAAPEPEPQRGSYLSPADYTAALAKWKARQGGEPKFKAAPRP